MNKEALKAELTEAMTNALVEFSIHFKENMKRLVDEFECEPKSEPPKGSLDLPVGFAMITDQTNKDDVFHVPYDERVGNNRWMSETYNGAYFSVNAWGFGGIAGGTQELEDACVSIRRTLTGLLAFEWWVGGFWRDFGGNPEHGWWSKKGGNNVKAYPRLGIGSASGQEVATVGAPFDVPEAITSGWTHIHQDRIQHRCGLPHVLQTLPKIDIHLDFEMKSEFTGKHTHGSYFMAVDSYLHDVNTFGRTAVPALAGRMDGINDTSGSIFNQPMSQLSETTKEWAIMIWLAESPFYETSGGRNIGMIKIKEDWYDVKFKIETASDKKFKYLSFTRRVDSALINDQTGTINYNDFVEAYTGQPIRNMLEDMGEVEDVDGVQRIIEPPNKTMILSDINFGIEVLCNPDTEQDTKKYPVTCEFKELTFEVQGKGKFGFKADT